MDDLIFFQKFRQNTADGIIDGNRSLASADNEDNRFVCGKSAEVQCGKFIAMQKLFTNRLAGQDCFSFRNVTHGFREVAAYFCCSRKRNLVCKSRCHIGFMDNNRDMEMFGCKNNRNSYKTALGKNNIRFQLFQDFTCLTIAF